MISKSLKTFKFIFSNLRHSQTSLFLSVRIYTSNQPIAGIKGDLCSYLYASNVLLIKKKKGGRKLVGSKTIPVLQNDSSASSVKSVTMEVKKIFGKCLKRARAIELKFN